VEKYHTTQQATDANILWSMRFACWITKLTDTHSVYVILVAFHCNIGCANAPQYYVVRTLPVFIDLHLLATLVSKQCCAYLLAHQFLSRDGTECVRIKIMLGTFSEPEHQQH
jgi:hypothetical protein